MKGNEMKNIILKILTLILCVAAICSIASVSALAAASDGYSATATDGIIVGALIFLVALFMASLVFLGAVLMKTKRK